MRDIMFTVLSVLLVITSLLPFIPKWYGPVDIPLAFLSASFVIAVLQAWRFSDD